MIVKGVETIIYQEKWTIARMVTQRNNIYRVSLSVDKKIFLANVNGMKTCFNEKAEFEN